MNKRIMTVRLGLFLLVVLSIATAAFAQGSEDQVTAQGYASVSAVRPGDKFKVAVAIKVADGYHINAHVPSEDFLIATEIKFEPPPGIRILEPMYPPAKLVKFEFSEKELAVLEGTVILTAEAEATDSLKPGAVVIPARLTVQACSDHLCLAPGNLSVEIPLPVLAAGKSVQKANADLFERAELALAAAPPAAAATELKEFQGQGQKTDALSERIAASGIFVVLLSVFFSGLLLNATPCVYPIIPITIGFFMNQGGSGGAPRLRRTFLLASMYVLGMAITYSILGVIASMTQGLFGAALQNPFVLVGLAALMVALALSMFGLYEFRLPESLNEFANRSQQSTSGVLGALVMGLTMGIVAAPCIGPFVLALLVHVGAKGDPVYGFFMFFVLALGLGSPYLVLGTFSGAIKSLPRSGTWMVTVRKVFGVVLVGMALYFVMPLLGSAAAYTLIAFLLVAALYLIFYEAGRTKPAQVAWVLRAIGVGAAVAAVFLAIPRKPEAAITWQPYTEQSLAAAQREGKAVIIDTYADWCIPCKELDQLTFTDSGVRREADRFVTLKLDLTRNDPESEAGRAKKKFDIRGVPTVIFLDPSGREQTDLRLEGFEKASAFLARMRRVESSPEGTSGERVMTTSAGEKGAVAGANVASGAGEPAPAVSLSLLGGGTIDLQSLRGKVVLIDFWATWCVPCISEIPMFNELHRGYKDRGLELIAVSLDEEGASVVKPFLKRYPMAYTQALGDESTAKAFNVSDSSLPVALLVDKKGRVRFTHVGITKKEVFESEINQLLGE